MSGIDIPEGTTFEEAQRALASRVAQLESGEAGLDEAVRIFEEAMAYQRFCERRLTEIKGRIEELTAEDLPSPGPGAPPADDEEDDGPF
jgi:exodeoxyribonuclease VII small subunit